LTLAVCFKESDVMKMLQNNKGIALVTALMFTLISLGIVMLLLSSIIQGTKAYCCEQSL